MTVTTSHLPRSKYVASCDARAGLPTDCHLDKELGGTPGTSMDGGSFYVLISSVLTLKKLYEHLVHSQPYLIRVTGAKLVPLSLRHCLMSQDPEVDTLCEGFSLELGGAVIPLRLLYTVIKQGHTW